MLTPEYKQAQEEANRSFFKMIEMLYVESVDFPTTTRAMLEEIEARWDHENLDNMNNLCGITSHLCGVRINAPKRYGCFDYKDSQHWQ